MTRRKVKEYDWTNLEFDETILPVNYTKSGPRRPIDYIVLHHMAIPDLDIFKPDALDACYRVWTTPGTKASAHYGVEQGFVRQYVWDYDIAWANNNSQANLHSISIEHANRNLSPNYPISEKTWKTGARLCAHLHNFYNLGYPTYGKTIHIHKEFSATACPGPTLSTLAQGSYLRECRRIYQQITGTTKPNAPKKDLVIIATECIRGDWGNGEERVRRLRDAGYDPEEVQKKINEILSQPRRRRAENDRHY